MRPVLYFVQEPRFESFQISLYLKPKLIVFLPHPSDFLEKERFLPQLPSKAVLTLLFLHYVRAPFTCSFISSECTCSTKSSRYCKLSAFSYL